MAGTATAFAVIPDSSGVIHGCYSKNNGTLSVIDSSTATCGRGETALNWNQTGPKGDTGPAGANGNTILHGTGAPASSLGATGDFYIDTVAHSIYGPKTDDGWGAATSIQGSPWGPNVTSLTTATSGPPVAVLAQQTLTLEANCPSGTKVLDGNYRLYDVATGSEIFTVDFSGPDYPAEAWRVVVHNPNLTNDRFYSLTVIARCGTFAQ